MVIHFEKFVRKAQTAVHFNARHENRRSKGFNHPRGIYDFRKRWRFAGLERSSTETLQVDFGHNLAESGGNKQTSGFQRRADESKHSIRFIILLDACKMSQSNRCGNRILLQIENSEKEWWNWYEKEKPEEEDLPCGYQKSLDVFRKLLLIRSWSPDRTLSQARKYISG